MIKSRLLASAAMSLAIASSSFAQTNLRDGFVNPPDSAKPRTWWHWMSGNITKEGITLDMEGMKRAGIGGCQLFDAELGKIETGLPRVDYLSPQWIDMVNHAASEADRLGLELTADKHVWLDLGDVKLIAGVKLNGKDVSTLWRTPFKADITAAAKAGTNDLEIAVTNTWPNRLIGDVALPPEKRVTWSPFNPYKSDSPLVESGLLGPVTLRQSVVVEVK